VAVIVQQFDGVCPPGEPSHHGLFRVKLSGQLFSLSNHHPTTDLFYKKGKPKLYKKCYIAAVSLAILQALAPKKL
jgi:hypothetical protein